MDEKIKVLQEQIHFLVELLTNKQLEEFVSFCINQNYVENKEDDPQILGKSQRGQ